MKTIGKIIRWILGAMFCLAGLIMVSEAVLTGILWILAGLSLLPPITERIALFGQHKAISVICCVCLLFAGIMALPDTGGTGTDNGETVESADSGNGKADGNQSAEQKEKQEVAGDEAKKGNDKQAENDKPKQEEDEFDKKKLEKWLAGKLSEDNPSVSQKEI